MRISNDGITLWHGTKDAPAPSASVAADTNTSVTIAVQPVHPGYYVELRYRVNNVEAPPVKAQWQRIDSKTQTQYHKAVLPKFRKGDIVDYVVTCSCEGRQAPAAEEAKRFPSSFHVADPTLRPASGVPTAVPRPQPPPPEHSMSPVAEAPTSKTLLLDDIQPEKTVLENLSFSKNVLAIEERLNRSLRSGLSTFFSGHVAIQQRIRGLPDVNVSTNHGKTIRDLLVSAVDNSGFSQEQKNEFESSLSKIPQALTVETFLHLNGPIKDDPVFQTDVKVATISSLLRIARLPPVAVTKFLTHYRRHNLTPSGALWNAVGQDPELKGNLTALQFTLSAAVLTRDNVHLVKDLQALREEGTIGTPQDLVNVDWNKVIGARVANGTIKIPSDVPGATEAKRTENYIASIANAVDKEYHTAAFARDFSRDLAAGNAQKVFGAASLDFPRFFRNCQDFDLAATHVRSYLTINQDKAFSPVVGPHAAFASTLLGLQRLYRVTRSYADVAALKRGGFESAHTVARIPKTTFLSKYADSLGGAERAAQVHAAAVHRAATMLNVFAKYSRSFNKTPIAAVGQYKFAKAKESGQSAGGGSPGRVG